MSAVSQVFALVAALIHVQVFVLESVLWSRPAVYRRFLVRSDAEAEVVRPFMLNQGFYNLLLAAGILVGLVLLHVDGHQTAGRAVVVFCCASIVVAALVLLATDRKLARAALIQGLPPALALATLTV